MQHQVAVRYRWETIGPVLGTGAGLTWPRMPGGAGVYRITLQLADRTRHYVGETDNYRRRFSQYANPGPTQSTNLKMKARLLELLNSKGGSAQLQVAVDVVVLVDGVPTPASEMPDVFTRRLLENAALLEVAAFQGEIINGNGFPGGEL